MHLVAKKTTCHFASPTLFSNPSQGSRLAGYLLRKDPSRPGFAPARLKTGRFASGLLFGKAAPHGRHPRAARFGRPSRLLNGIGDSLNALQDRRRRVGLFRRLERRLPGLIQLIEPRESFFQTRSELCQFAFELLGAWWIYTSGVKIE